MLNQVWIYLEVHTPGDEKQIWISPSEGDTAYLSTAVCGIISTKIPKAVPYSKVCNVPVSLYGVKYSTIRP